MLKRYLKVSTISYSCSILIYEKSFEFVFKFNADVDVDTTIIAITASDSDSPSLVYSIAGGNDGGYFKINSMHGVIQTARNLDREQIPVFNLLVEAQDEDSNRGTTRLQVTISDVNDEAPQFLQPEYFARVSENSPRGTQVIPVSYFNTKRQGVPLHCECKGLSM